MSLCIPPPALNIYSPAWPCTCTGVHLYICTSVQVYRCTPVQHSVIGGSWPQVTRAWSCALSLTPAPPLSNADQTDTLNWGQVLRNTSSNYYYFHLYSSFFSSVDKVRLRPAWPGRGQPPGSAEALLGLTAVLSARISESIQAKLPYYADLLSYYQSNHYWNCIVQHQHSRRMPYSLYKYPMRRES